MQGFESFPLNSALVAYPLYADGGQAQAYVDIQLADITASCQQLINPPDGGFGPFKSMVIGLFGPAPVVSGTWDFDTTVPGFDAGAYESQPMQAGAVLTVEGPGTQVDYLAVVGHITLDHMGADGGAGSFTFNMVNGDTAPPYPDAGWISGTFSASYCQFH